MSLKTSLFNKSILKSDIKRFWWIALLESLFIFGTSVVPLWENCKDADIIGSSYLWCVPTWKNGSIVLLILFAIGVGVGLFTYMHFSASVSMHHSIPVKRKTILSTKLLTGLILTVVPIVINAVIFTLTFIDPTFREFYGIGDVFCWLASGVLYTLVLLSLTTVVNMMTGNPVGTLIFTGGFAVLPLVFCSFFEAFFGIELFGYTERIMNVIDKIYIAEDSLVTFPYFLIYIAITAVCLSGAYMLYKKRKLENHGEVIAFSWLKPVFIAIVAVLASMASYLYFRGIMGIESILSLIPIGLLGTVIAYMIARKQLSLRGVLKPALIYVVCALAFCAVIHFDLTGFERRVPDTEDIAKVQIVRDGTPTHQYYIKGERINFILDSGLDKSFIAKTDIENVKALHQHLIDEKDSTDRRNAVLPIVYTLKDGSTIEREYCVDFNLDKEYLKPIYETPQMKAELFPIADGRERNFTRLTIQDRRINSGADVTLYPNDEYMQKLIDALEADIAATKYGEFVSNSGASTRINIFYINKYTVDRGNIEDFRDIWTDNSEYSIRTSYKNTMAVLNEMGFYSTIPTSSDIAKATVTTWDTEDELSAKDYEVENAVEVTDSGEIDTLYSFYDSMIETQKFTDYEMCRNIRITYTLKSGTEFMVSCSYDPDKIPQEFAKYFK